MQVTGTVPKITETRMFCFDVVDSLPLCINGRLS